MLVTSDAGGVYVAIDGLSRLRLKEIGKKGTLDEFKSRDCVPIIDIEGLSCIHLATAVFYITKNSGATPDTKHERIKALISAAIPLLRVDAPMELEEDAEEDESSSDPSSPAAPQLRAGKPRGPSIGSDDLDNKSRMWSKRINQTWHLLRGLHVPASHMLRCISRGSESSALAFSPQIMPGTPSSFDFLASPKAVFAPQSGASPCLLFIVLSSPHVQL